MSGAVRLDGPLNREVLQRALNRIVMRHEALRTCFVREEGEPIQVIRVSGIGGRTAVFSASSRSASADSTGASNTVPSATSTDSACRRRDTSCTASSEWPPSSKKLSWHRAQRHLHRQRLPQA